MRKQIFVWSWPLLLCMAACHETDPFLGFIDGTGFPAPLAGDADGEIKPTRGHAEGGDVWYYDLGVWPTDPGEDANGNGRLDPKEDIDQDGALDVHNVYLFEEGCDATSDEFDPQTDSFDPTVQGPIFSQLPDNPDYTPYVRVTRVTPSGGYECNAVKSEETVLERCNDDFDCEATGEVVNMAVVGTNVALVDPLDPAGSVSPLTSWNDGLLTTYFEFSTVATDDKGQLVPMDAFFEEEALFPALPGDVGFSSLCNQRFYFTTLPLEPGEIRDASLIDPKSITDPKEPFLFNCAFRPDPRIPDRDDDGVADDIEDFDGDGNVDVDEDVDLDGFLDFDEDANDNGVLDEGEDLDGDGVLDVDEDLDGDGALDYAEIDPDNPDSDGDGLTDGEENRDGDIQWDPTETNPLLTDSDFDGIDDGAETVGGTDPINPDTDGDGLQDGEEIATDPATDPLNPDSDADSCSDGAEVTLMLTLPTDPDTDGDGIADGGEDLNCNGVLDVNETDPLVP